jgi:hypothetical protein
MAVSLSALIFCSMHGHFIQLNELIISLQYYHDISNFLYWDIERFPILVGKSCMNILGLYHGAYLENVC